MIFNTFILIMIISMTLARKLDDDETDDINKFVPVTKQQLRGFPIITKSFEAFKKIHEKVITIAVDGGTEHKYKLCFENHNITTMINDMMRETFPDSTIESTRVGNCTICKINW